MNGSRRAGRSVHELAIARRLVADEKILTDAGFDIYEPIDIGEAPELMAKTGRPAESPMLGFSNNDFTTANGKFLFLMKNGEPIAGCRSKLVDLQDETFEAHQRRAVRHWYGTDEDMIVSIAPPLNRLIRGKHVYAGELEFREDQRGSKSITTAFVRVLIASSLLKWPDVNCVYCILPERHWHLAIPYGFNTLVRNAFAWKEPIPGGRLADWLVAVSSRDQLLHDLTAGYWGPTPHKQE